jgi:hypothetical protein
MWVEFDLHRIIRENDRILLRVTVPSNITAGHLRASAIHLIQEMKNDVFFPAKDQFVLADIPQTIAKVTNAYPDVNGQPLLTEPILSDEVHEVAARIYVPADARTEETR